MLLIGCEVAKMRYLINKKQMFALGIFTYFAVFLFNLLVFNVNDVFAQADVNTSFEYYCTSGNFSVENITQNNITKNLTSIKCQYGCFNDTPLTCYNNRVPQCDLCKTTDDFWLNFIAIGAFLGSWLFLSIFFIFSKKLPE